MANATAKKVFPVPAEPKPKIKSFDKLYHGQNHQTKSDFNYRRIWGLKEFKDKQPKLLDAWVKKNTHPIDILSLPTSYRLGDWDLIVSDLIENLTGYRIGEYKNYNLIR